MCFIHPDVTSIYLMSGKYVTFKNICMCVCIYVCIYTHIFIANVSNMYIVNVPNLARGFNDYSLHKYMICRMMADWTITEHFTRITFEYG